jgi:hypothetical protein
MSDREPKCLTRFGPTLWHFTGSVQLGWVRTQCGLCTPVDDAEFSDDESLLDVCLVCQRLVTPEPKE